MRWFYEVYYLYSRIRDVESANIVKLKAATIQALGKPGLCFAISFKNKSCLCRPLLPVVWTFWVLTASNRIVFLLVSCSFICPPILLHSRWLLHTLPQQLLSFLLPGCVTISSHWWQEEGLCLLAAAHMNHIAHQPWNHCLLFRGIKGMFYGNFFFVS